MSKEMPTSITTGAKAESASDSQISSWIELPSDVWALIGSHLSTKDIARASTVIKMLGGVQPQALNMAHTLTQINKVRELVWGRKRSSRVLSAEIGLWSLGDHLFELCPMVLVRTWSFPCIKELSLDVRITDVHSPELVKTASAFGKSFLAQMAQLQLLELRAHLLVPLPVMPRLRHLTIMLDWLVPLPFKDAVKSIVGLPVLQTLHAEFVVSVGHATSCQPVRRSGHPFSPVVDLDLRTCASLQAVFLRGMIPNKVLLPPATKLTLDIKVSKTPVHCNGLRLSGHPQLWFLKHKIDFSMLSSLSLQDVKNHGAKVVAIRLGDYARQLRFLSVTCCSNVKNLSLILSLPKLSTLAVHAAECLELKFDDLKTHAARLDAVSIQWKVSDTLHLFEEALHAHCRKDIYAGVLEDPNQPDLMPCHFISIRQIEDVGGTGELNQIHPCTVAATACGACLEHCCPRVHPVPQP